MKKKDVEDYASTKHKGLPYKVKQEIINKNGPKCPFDYIKSLIDDKSIIDMSQKNIIFGDKYPEDALNIFWRNIYTFQES